jgi:hypothetical protein
MFIAHDLLNGRIRSAPFLQLLSETEEAAFLDSAIVCASIQDLPIRPVPLGDGIVPRRAVRSGTNIRDAVEPFFFTDIQGGNRIRGDPNTPCQFNTEPIKIRTAVD